MKRIVIILFVLFSYIVIYAAHPTFLQLYIPVFYEEMENENIEVQQVTFFTYTGGIYPESVFHAVFSPYTPTLLYDKPGMENNLPRSNINVASMVNIKIDCESEYDSNIKEYINILITLDVTNMVDLPDKININHTIKKTDILESIISCFEINMNFYSFKNVGLKIVGLDKHKDLLNYEYQSILSPKRKRG